MLLIWTLWQTFEAPGRLGRGTYSCSLGVSGRADVRTAMTIKQMPAGAELRHPYMPLPERIDQ